MPLSTQRESYFEFPIFLINTLKRAVVLFSRTLRRSCCEMRVSHEIIYSVSYLMLTFSSAHFCNPPEAYN